VKSDRRCGNAGRLGVVITGGTSGIGLALARVFLAAGDRVVICGRDSVRLERAMQELRQQVPEGEIHGMSCDVSRAGDIGNFAAFTKACLGRVDRWINNAGSAGALKRPLWELDCHDIQEVSGTNLGGTMMACSLAVRLMLEQPASTQPAYHIFNMGFSPGGARFSHSSAPHRASKLAVGNVTAFLRDELRRNHIGWIGVHELSPGLVKTPLLFRDAPPSSLRFLEAVAEEPETAAASLVPKIRSVKSRGCRIRLASFPVSSVRLKIKKV